MYSTVTEPCTLNGPESRQSTIVHLCFCFACRFGAETFTFPGILRDKSVSCTQQFVIINKLINHNKNKLAIFSILGERHFSVYY